MSCGTCWDPTYCPRCDRDESKVEAAANEAVGAIMRAALRALDDEARGADGLEVMQAEIKRAVLIAMRRDVFRSPVWDTGPVTPDIIARVENMRGPR